MKEAKNSLIWVEGNLKKCMDLKPSTKEEKGKTASATWWPPGGSAPQGIGEDGSSGLELPET